MRDLLADKDFFFVGRGNPALGFDPVRVQSARSQVKRKRPEDNDLALSWNSHTKRGGPQVSSAVYHPFCRFRAQVQSRLDNLKPRPNSAPYRELAGSSVNHSRIIVGTLTPAAV